IKDIAYLRPLLYWVRLWKTDELEPYRAAVKELLPPRHGWEKVRWLREMKAAWTKLSLSHYWENPEMIPGNAKRLIKDHYWEKIYEES
ncbi:hypothetical protein NDU88_004353, partial [Pleurodeles waltl]